MLRQLLSSTIQQAHAQVSKMETTMEARQVIQDTAKVKPVRPRQVPASSRSTNTPIQPCIEDTHQRISPPVAMEARQTIQVTAEAKSVRPRWGPVSLQGKPGSVAIQPHVEDTDNLSEVADMEGMEVDAHQVTAPAIADYTSNKPQSGRTATHMLRRQGAVTDLDLLAHVVSTCGSNEFSQQILSTSIPSLTSRATTTVNSNANLAYQGKMPAPTHNMDKEELEDQPAFPVKVVGHDKFKVVASMANDVQSDNEFNQLIFEEVQAGSKCKHPDCDDANYVTSSKVEDFNDEYFNIEDCNLNSCMLPAKELLTMEWTNQRHQRLTGMQTKNHNRQAPQKVKYLQKGPQARPAMGKLWTKAIIPTLLVWAGSLADSWTISDDELIQSLQIIILTIAPDFEDLNDIHPGMVIFNIVLCVNNSASGAATLDPLQLLLITHFLVLDPEIGVPSLAQAQELCSKLLEGFAFLYVDQDSRKPENIFWSYFILFLLGHAHLRPCADSPDVPKLKIRELKKIGVKGVLALCCAVLHHTLSLFKTSKLQIDVKYMSFRKAVIKIPLKVNKMTRKELSAVSAFSKQNCGPHTRQYAIAINKHDNAMLHDIIVGVTILMPCSMDAVSEEGSFQHGEDDVDDLIAALFIDRISSFGCDLILSLPLSQVTHWQLQSFN
ncbi:hypothetical protein F5J12DRAFT_781821 [Pisolithus orientalis]|uniref:uncharacterized protein n=1 Tax=Pisolithus orientalis TaxID=936130 RepID=UPI00222418B1|nr:uncharacterized protein F5J12DRAFT_781821 [Pisolithus orientalis]KAI6010847.1 hypothetical protein F5J12DRAFT_781821 [Pisolithus orientalis]